MTQSREDVAGRGDDQWWRLVYRCTSDWWVRGVYVEHHGPSGTAIFLTPVGVKRGTRIVTMAEQDGSTSLVRPAKAVEEEDVAPLALSPASCVARRRVTTRRA